MDKAWLPGKVPGSGKVISVSDIDPAKPPLGLTCAFALCAGRTEPPHVHFVRQGLLEGGQSFRAAHFATNARDWHKHSPECWFAGEHQNKKRDARIAEALRTGKYILANLNISAEKNPERIAPGSNYDRWRKRNKYCAVSVKTPSDYLLLKERIIKSGGDAALEKLRIGHDGEVLRPEQFEIGDDPQKFKDVYGALRSERVFGRDIVDGHVRLFRFTRDASVHWLEISVENQAAATSILLAQKQGVRASLTNRLYLNPSMGLPDDGASFYVIAKPKIRNTEISQRNAAFQAALRAGQKSEISVTMRWDIISAAQMTPAPQSNATPKCEAPREAVWGQQTCFEFVRA